MCFIISIIIYIMKNKHYKNHNVIGGDIFGSGGFGCLIRPALQCKNAAAPNNNTVSKLMTKKHTDSEFNEYKSISAIYVKFPIIKNIF
jgi:hypothetical protein